MSDPLFAIQSTNDYLTNQTGPLSSSGGNFVGMFSVLCPICLESKRIAAWEKLPQPYRSHLSPQTQKDLSQFPPDWPELELLPIATTLATVNDTANYASIEVALGAPTSLGNVTINSTDTTYNPLVNPNWLGSQTDQEIAIGGFRRAREIMNATGLVIGPEFAPGPAVQSDAQILAFVKQTLSTLHHAVGTCKSQPQIPRMA